MQVHHFLWEDVSMPHIDFGMKMLFSPSSHNELFILNIIIIILFLTERQGGTPLPAPLGPPGSPPQPQGGRPGRRGVTGHLCPPARPRGRLMEEPQRSGSREDVRPPCRRPSAANPECLGLQLHLRGAISRSGRAYVLVVFGLEDAKADRVLRAVPESQNTKPLQSCSS